MAAPATSLYVPAGHGVELVAPVDDTKDPAGAGVHAAAATLELNVPAAHSVALVFPVPAA